jgi:hypothetical protein
MTNITYDIIIIGGGISGLYSAYNIQKLDPSKKILILEASSKKNMGGRLGNKKFHGVSIVTGAGVVRKEKDFLLIKLLKELEIPYNEFQAKTSYSDAIPFHCDVKKSVDLLKKELKKIFTSENKGPILTFKEFATKVLGKEKYKEFSVCLGYTDYENEDFIQTLTHYGLEDNYNTWTGFGISWKLLIHKLVERIGFKNIIFSSKVTKITKNKLSNNFTIYKENYDRYYCKKIIIATTIDTVRKLLPKMQIYKKIHGQTFLRLYAKFSKESNLIMKEKVNFTTIVNGPLHKVIPINKDKGIYMIAYSDNNDAKFLHKYVKNKDYLARLLEKSLGITKNTLKIDDLTDFYWKIGTHYYDPLDKIYKSRNDFINKAQHPMDGILVVGEMISNNQGWTQGALESVNNVLWPYFIKMAQS